MATLENGHRWIRGHHVGGVWVTAVAPLERERPGQMGETLRR